jgi:transcription initiation factor TFIID TATA-box-binding protein
VNVVATADLNQLVDIVAAGMLRDFLHDSEKYGGKVVYYKSKGMRGKVTIFPSGKMISVGTTNIEDAFNNFHLTANALSEKLVKPTFSNMKIRNIVATVDFKKNIDIKNMAMKLDAIYEPEQFPGAILHLEKPKVTALLFASGKVVISGAKDVESIIETVSLLPELVFSPYQIGNTINKRL